MKRITYISFPNDPLYEHDIKIGIDWYVLPVNLDAIDATNKYFAKVGFPEYRGPHYETFIIKLVLFSRVYIFEIKLREVKREEE